MSNETKRREFLRDVGVTFGTAAVAPAVLSACNRQAETETTPEPEVNQIEPEVETAQPAQGSLDVPTSRPSDWDVLAFNRERGNAGAIPEAFRETVNSPEGGNNFLGKHLPYLPHEGAPAAPEGFLAVMFGDASAGYPRHPASPVGTAGYEDGHWFDWVKIRKAVDGDAEEVESTFTSWPEPGEGQTGQYAVLGGGEITENAGTNTVYLVRLPADVSPGDAIRVIGHCNVHGEYVDFLTIPPAAAAG